MQTARYRGQRGALQVRAVAPTIPLSAALGFFLADGSLPRETKCLAGGGFRSHTPAFRCARLLSCRRLATAGNEAPGRWGLPPLHPRFLLRSACLAESLLSRAANRLADGDCRPTPLFSLRSTFVLQTARYRGHRNVLQLWAAAPTLPLSAALGFCLPDASLPRAMKRFPSCALAHSYREHHYATSNFSCRCAN
jgi:hypothetical protein